MQFGKHCIQLHCSICQELFLQEALPDHVRKCLPRGWRQECRTCGLFLKKITPTEQRSQTQQLLLRTLNPHVTSRLRAQYKQATGKESVPLYKTSRVVKHVEHVCFRPPYVVSRNLDVICCFRFVIFLFSCNSILQFQLSGTFQPVNVIDHCEFSTQLQAYILHPGAFFTHLCGCINFFVLVGFRVRRKSLLLGAQICSSYRYLHGYHHPS